MSSLKLATYVLNSSKVLVGWNRTFAEKSVKAGCTKDEEVFKKTCKKKEEIPCENRARGDDCTAIPPKVKIECPKAVQDCTAVATTKPPDDKVEAKKTADDKVDKEGKKEEEAQIALAEPIKPSDHHDDEGCDPKVVVIGAGLSGLCAANRLFTMGVGNITILEATNRAGGRLQSMAFGDTIVNLGGVWSEDDAGESDNNFMDNPLLYHACNLGLVSSSKHMHLVKSIITGCDGAPLPLPASFLALTKMIRIIGVAESLKATSPYTDQGRADAYIGMRMQQELRSISDDLKAPAARVFTALAILTTGKTYMGSDGFGPYISIPGSNIKIPLGCTSVLAPLLQNVAKYVKYCKEVVNISWGSLSGLNGRRALVRTTDGCQYNADFVVFTPSLGVLKNDHEKIFCPNLPCPKVKSIEKIKYESVNRVFLYYKKPVSSWRQDKIYWQLDEDEGKSLTGPLKGLREIKELFGSERVIGVTFAGEGAILAETVTEKSLINDITNYIRKRSGEAAPCPDDFFRTKWTNNKYFRGSRATKGCSLIGQPLPICGSPNPPVLYFAGDSTCEVNPGQAKGAFTSGLREADRILSYLPGNKDEVQATDSCLQLQAALSA